MSFSHSACGPSSPDACAAGDEGAEAADISSLLGMLASSPIRAARREYSTSWNSFWRSA